jgi:hypothetical protein
MGERRLLDVARPSNDVVRYILHYAYELHLARWIVRLLLPGKGDVALVETSKTVASIKLVTSHCPAWSAARIFQTLTTITYEAVSHQGHGHGSLRGILARDLSDYNIIQYRRIRG